MKLSEWLKRENVKGIDFARRIGRSQPMVSKYLHGKAIPSADAQTKIFLVTKGEVSPNDWMLVANCIEKAEIGSGTLEQCDAVA